MYDCTVLMFAVNDVFNENFPSIASSAGEDFTLDSFSCIEIKSSAEAETTMVAHTSGIKLVLLFFP